MSVLAFDTHAAVKKLQQAGFTEQQAEAQTALLMDVIVGEVATKLDVENVRTELKHDIEAVRLDIENVRADLKRDIEAVKLDIENVRAELKRDIETLRAESKHDIAELKRDVAELKHDMAEVKRDIAELKRDMKELEMRLTIKLGAMLVIGVGVVATLVKLL